MKADVNLAELSREQKRELLERVLRESVGSRPQLFEQFVEEVRKSRPDVEDAYPLTVLQTGMLFHSELDSRSAVYHDIFSLLLHAAWDEGQMRRALRMLFQRHPVLRTSFDLSSFSEPLQLVHREVEPPFEVEDLRHLDAEEQRSVVSAWMEREKKDRFQWARAPLIRFQAHWLGDKVFRFSWAEHHAILDGWSVAAMSAELLQLYLWLLGQAELPLPAPRATFREYVSLERKAIASDGFRTFWEERLRDRSSSPLSSWRSSRPADAGGRSVRSLNLQLPPAAEARLVETARRAAVPLKTVLLAAHLRALTVLTGRSDVVTGLVTNGRPEEADGERVLGLFLNSLPLRLRLAGGTWLDLVQETFRAEQELLPYRRYPMALLQEYLAPGQPLFDTLFTFNNFHILKEIRSQQSLILKQTASYMETNYDLALYCDVDSVRGDLQLWLDYNPAFFPEEQAREIAICYERVLEELATAPSSRYEGSCLLGQAQRLQLLGWSRQREEPSGAPCLSRLFEAQAERSPDAIALTFGEEHCRYAELNTRANRLARHLRRLGVEPEVMVGICLERIPDLLVSILAVLKAGGAYVPLDVTYPKERLAAVLADARITVLITEEDGFGGTVVSLARDSAVLSEEPGDNLDSSPAAGHAAYMIYTSGSTGTPKGVVVSHANVVRLFASTQTWFQFNAQDVWTLFHAATFDFSVWEIWGALLHGGRLVIVPAMTARSPHEFHELLREQRVTVLNQTPSAFRQLMRVDEESGDRGRELALRLVVFGGEALDIKDLGAWMSLHGSDRPRLVNMYGITETTVHVTYRPISSEYPSRHSVSPIGVPIPDLGIFVLDEHLQLVPVGVAGEMFVGGAGVTRGYFGRPDLTAERFIPDPFSPRPGSRLYRSGDLARWLPGGELVYEGRIDHQVKVRGFRIELGEIESHLRQHPGVQDAVVVLRKDAGESELVAYVQAERSGAVNNSTVRRFLQERLPDYMIPSRLLLLERMPLTPHGKVDRRALPAIGSQRPELEREYVAPRNTVEEELARIWAESLTIEKIGAFDSFFELGGQSLKSVQIISKIRDRLGVQLPLRALYEAPTLAELALRITIEIAKESGQDRLAEALAEVENLSADALEAMLLPGSPSAREAS